MSRFGVLWSAGACSRFGVRQLAAALGWAGGAVEFDATSPLRNPPPPPTPPKSGSTLPPSKAAPSRRTPNLRRHFVSSQNRGVLDDPSFRISRRGTLVLDLTRTGRR